MADVFLLDPAGTTCRSFGSDSILIDRLERFVAIGPDERDVVNALTATRRTFQPDKTLVREGNRADRVFLILSGVAYRYRILPNGRRQIFGYLLPGDICDTHFVISDRCDHNVGLLCETEVAVISLPALMHAMVAFPKIERALLMMSLIDSAVLREWLLNVAQGDAARKLAHFFCELSARFRAFDGACSDQGFNIPLTQADLADTMGLTVVHVNRIMQRLRRDGLLNWSRRHFDVLDYPRLKHLAGFDAGYLRLERVQHEPRVSAYG